MLCFGLMLHVVPVGACDFLSFYNVLILSCLKPRLSVVKHAPSPPTHATVDP